MNASAAVATRIAGGMDVEEAFMFEQVGDYRGYMAPTAGLGPGAC